MIQYCKFNKACDLGLVMQGLGRDVQKMIDSGVIEDNEAEVVYNQLESLEQVGSKVTDTFDALVVSRYLHSQSIQSNVGTGSSQAAGSTAPVQSSE